MCRSRLLPMHTEYAGSADAPTHWITPMSRKICVLRASRSVTDISGSPTSRRGKPTPQGMPPTGLLTRSISFIPPQQGAKSQRRASMIPCCIGAFPFLKRVRTTARQSYFLTAYGTSTAAQRLIW